MRKYFRKKLLIKDDFPFIYIEANNHTKKGGYVMRYIVTCYGGGENYTPSFFEDRCTAYEMFYTNVITTMTSFMMIDEDKEEELLDNLKYLSVLDMGKMEVLKKLERVTHGFVIGQDDNEVVIQIFEIR